MKSGQQPFHGVRRYPRINAELTARIMQPGDLDTGDAALVKELGQGGCLLASPRQLGVRRVVLLEINLGRRRMRAVGRVLYEYPSDGLMYQGFCFDHTHEDDEKELTDYIEAQLPHAASWIPARTNDSVAQQV